MFRISAVLLLAGGVASGVALAADKSPLQAGIEFYQAGKYEQAEPLLRKAADSAGVLSIYQQYFLADTLSHLNKQAEAIALLKGILVKRPPAEIKHRALFLLGQQDMAKAHWRDARDRLRLLVRKWRSSPQYPQVLYGLMRTELKLHNRPRACNWARKLYTRYPADPLVDQWTGNAAEVKVDGEKIGCLFRTGDFQERVKRLELLGESDRARKEIEKMKAAAPENEKDAYDLMLAHYLVNEGMVEDALALLVRNYPKEKSDFNYLTQLGVAAARAGEYQTAVGAYEKAHALSPHSRKGREALFQAAFLSYQFQDYDGAVKKFNELVQGHPRSALARDARWHLAWLQYLRNDYDGALKMMMDVRLSSLHARRFRGSILDQRLLYWMAMSQLRLNQLDEAKAAFQSLIHDSPGGYYALAAQARLAQLAKQAPSSRATASVAAAPTPQVKADTGDESDDDDSEEAITKDTQETDADDKDTSDTEPLDAAEFKEPALRAHLEAARELTALNLTDLARSELWEVERRTTNPVYLKMLISAYEAIGSFNRSASISELDFMPERQRLGVDGARALWMSAFPQAYKKWVTGAATKYGVPDEWVWSIMRAESLYKPDVISPVGAKGLMQLMAFTGRNLARLDGNEQKFKVEDLMDPAKNINIGAQYLARLGKEFHQNLSLVAAAYNAGPHRVQGWLVSFGHLETDEFIEHIPFLETRNYVKKVLVNNYSYRLIYGKDSSPFRWLAEPLGVAIPSKIPTHENWDAI